MGKAAIVGAVVVVVLLIAASVYVWTRKSKERLDDKKAGRPLKGDMNARQERELVALVDEARQLLSGIGVNDTVEAMADPEVIRPDTRRAVTAWLIRYNQRKANTQ